MADPAPATVPAAPRVHRWAWSAAAHGWRGSRALWRIADAVARRPDRSVVGFGHGVVVPVASNDWIGRTAYEGTYERAELAIASRVVRPGGTVIDVGANIGVVALRAADWVGPTGRVVAVEPLPDLAARLRRAATEAGFTWLEVVEAAITDDPGPTVSLSVPEAATHGGLATLRAIEGGRVEVAARPLSAVAPAGEIDLVKVDVEGWEGVALRSGGDLLEERRVRWWLVEASPEFGALDELIDAMARLADHRLWIVTEQGSVRRRPALVETSLDELRGLPTQRNVLIGRPDVAARPPTAVRRSR